MAIDEKLLRQLLWGFIFLTFFILLALLALFVIKKSNSDEDAADEVTNTCLRYGLESLRCTPMDFAEVCYGVDPTSLDYEACHRACIVRGSWIMEQDSVECALESTCTSIGGQEPADIYFPRCSPCHWNYDTSAKNCSLSAFGAYCDKWSQFKSSLDICQEACAEDPLSMRCYDVIAYCETQACDAAQCDDGLDESPAEYYATRVERLHPCYSTYCQTFENVQEACASCDLDWLICAWDTWCVDENAAACMSQCTQGTWAACFTTSGLNYCQERGMDNCDIGKSSHFVNRVQANGCYMLPFDVGDSTYESSFMVYRPPYPPVHSKYAYGVDPPVWRAMLVMTLAVAIEGEATVTETMPGNFDRATHVWWCFRKAGTSDPITQEPHWHLISYDHPNMALYFDLSTAEASGMVMAQIRNLGFSYGVSPSVDPNFRFFIRDKSSNPASTSYYVMPAHDLEPKFLLQASATTGAFYFAPPLFRNDQVDYPVNAEMTLGTFRQFPSINGHVQTVNDLGHMMTFDFIEANNVDNVWWLWNIRSDTVWTSTANQQPAISFRSGTASHRLEFIEKSSGTKASKCLSSAHTNGGRPSKDFEVAPGFNLWLTTPVQPGTSGDGGLYSRYISYKQQYANGAELATISQNQSGTPANKNDMILVPFPFLALFYLVGITEDSSADSANFIIGQANTAVFTYAGNASPESLKWRSTINKQLFPSMRSSDSAVFYQREAEEKALWACKRLDKTTWNPLP